MCRIFGHFGTRVPHHRQRCAALLQRHGGPDAQYTASGSDWCLGNNRLAIVDLEGGRQPYDLNGKISVVFNGEIYNHDDLRKGLVSRGYKFSDRCDGSIIPALYAEYGVEFVDRLEGMYAIAIIDNRQKPTLRLFTDQVGMKSLFYYRSPTDGGLYFSSEIPALLSYAQLDHDPWAYGLESYLATKTPFGTRTMFENIRVMPPATVLTYDETGVIRMSSRPRPTLPSPPDFDGASALVQTTLRSEVKRMLAADVPVCAITSGGLDSSFITALASHESNRQLHTFNIAYKGTWPLDERAFAQQVASHCETTHHQVELDPRDFPSLLRSVVWHLGQPNADPITLSTFALFSEVRKAGFKVALTGDAADELFGGYSRICEAVNGGLDWTTAYVGSLAAIPRTMRSRLYSNEYRSYVQDRGWADERLLDGVKSLGASRLEDISRLEIGLRLPAYHLRRVDHLSMAHGVEARVPFCQPSVVALSQGLPADAKIRGQQRKRILYDAARDWVPESVLNRTKQPFTLPITAMLASGQPVFEMAGDLLAGDRIRRQGMLDPEAVSTLFNAQASDPSDGRALAVWSLFIHELWNDAFATRGHALPEAA